VDDDFVVDCDTLLMDDNFVTLCDGLNGDDDLVVDCGTLQMFVVQNQRFINLTPFPFSIYIYVHFGIMVCRYMLAFDWMNK
jgi:hypothetical protein